VKIVVNAANVTEKLDLAYGVAGYRLGELDRNAWLSQAHKAAAEVQGHPDTGRLVTPTEFEVEVSTNSYSVTPIGNDWSPTHTPE
jgi:hypothetical protein